MLSGNLYLYGHLLGLCFCTWKFIIKSPLGAGEKAYAFFDFWLLFYYITLFLFLFYSDICYFSTQYVSVFYSMEICCHFLLISFVGLLGNGCLSFCHEVFGNQIQVVCQIKNLSFQRLLVYRWQVKYCMWFFLFNVCLLKRMFDRMLLCLTNTMLLCWLRNWNFWAFFKTKLLVQISSRYWL